MSRRTELALALLRVPVGCLFMLHGHQKLFGAGLERVTEQFGAWGVPMPLLFAPLVSVLELVGALLVLGLGTQPVALLLALSMALALALVHLGGQGLSGALPRLILPKVEAPALLLTSCLALALGGPGWPSLDAAWKAGPKTGPGPARAAEPEELAPLRRKRR
ncbi:DoxX family protein [Deinococcus lacus]|uniref:DoxX family protein n=1 Tax=Deinococcus lacus TaxID=392561 RepID=A0ABW1YH90_9DEIO